MKEIPVYLFFASGLSFMVLFVFSDVTDYMIIGLLAFIASILIRVDQKL